MQCSAPCVPLLPKSQHPGARYSGEISVYNRKGKLGRKTLPEEDRKGDSCACREGEQVTHINTWRKTVTEDEKSQKCHMHNTLHNKAWPGVRSPAVAFLQNLLSLFLLHTHLHEPRSTPLPLLYLLRRELLFRLLERVAERVSCSLRRRAHVAANCMETQSCISLADSASAWSSSKKRH